MWGSNLRTRTHFEWVWDGQAIRIVQADVAESSTGVDPRSLLPSTIPNIEVASLILLHSASNEDYERYGKLKNAKLYRQLGYAMPVFYVLKNSQVLTSILSGEISPDLESDLTELTRRPLIIRTDGINLPPHKREMLPRSDELRSYSQAKDWLCNHFRPRVEENDLGSSDLCLIAHHFIPSVASAWAWAEPRNRIVRIESLWGIPEGLYWYSHDVFEVDTQDVVEFSRPGATSSYRSWDHLRYKGSFIAPDEQGKWIPYQPSPPYDWIKSIRKPGWLFEIAQTTRLIAEHEKHSVSVMWFIENHSDATSHKVLPWFHSKSELAGTPKAAPRRKLSGDGDFVLRTSEDWRRLQDLLKAGRRTERVVVEPIDVELIRNLKFAEDLADLAVSKGFVIELSGGILSHAYYSLQRRGAQVECVDLIGTEEDVVEYNKLVRDKIPELIEARGERVETVRLGGDALVAALREKLVEEAFEALDAKSGHDLISELADVEEVVKALSRALNVTPKHLETERKDKQRRRGAFSKGLMLTKTGTPHSIQKQILTPEPPSLDLKVLPSPEKIISQVADIPAKSVYRRPDLRQVEHQLEKLFTFATETNKIGEVKESLTFSIPIDSELQQNFTLTVELRRTGSSVRGVVRLRRNPAQLRMEFQPPDTQLKIEFPET